MITKKEFLKYHNRIARAKSLEELTVVSRELMHEPHCEPKDALFALAMSNKRVLYNLDYYDAVAKNPGPTTRTLAKKKSARPV